MKRHLWILVLVVPLLLVGVEYLWRVVTEAADGYPPNEDRHASCSTGRYSFTS
jgi:hypothetical protein